MISSVADIKNVFFIGIAGTGMSAVAQYLSGLGIRVSGSDRYFSPDTFNETREKLEAEGIRCFLQNGEGITGETNLVVVSTAVENTVPEVQKAGALSIPVIKRSELLAIIAESKRTIAVGGTSGKSTTSAMLFYILHGAGLNPSIISGAGLTGLIREGKIGNAKTGTGEWLVIEADESDGSIVQYHPEVGLLLNIDKDHQEISELMEIFSVFKNNTRQLFSVNRSNALAASLSAAIKNDFSISEDYPAEYTATNFSQCGLSITFNIKETAFTLNTVGRHNMENAVAAVAIANQLGVGLQTCAEALKSYDGIYRRHQVLAEKNGVCLIDDYAHNPVKCAASISACQQIAPKVIAWFQPHGYGPTRFLKDDFIREIAGVLRAEDEIWMSEIFYAGGTAVKDISANDLVEGIKELGKNSFFIANRNNFLRAVKPHLTNDCVLLLMGARDPGLESFAASIKKNL